MPHAWKFQRGISNANDLCIKYVQVNTKFVRLKCIFRSQLMLYFVVFQWDFIEKARCILL